MVSPSQHLSPCTQARTGDVSAVRQEHSAPCCPTKCSINDWSRQFLLKPISSFNFSFPNLSRSYIPQLFVNWVKSRLGFTSVGFYLFWSHSVAWKEGKIIEQFATDYLFSVVWHQHCLLLVAMVGWYRLLILSLYRM